MARTDDVALHEGRDLAVITDCRKVLAETKETKTIQLANA
jgi:hypothetical protein